MADPDRDEVKRKLDDVVGTQFDPLDSGKALRKRLPVWIAGVLCAIAAAALIVWVIETHRLPPENARPVTKKPVPVQIVPAQKPAQ